MNLWKNKTNYLNFKLINIIWVITYKGIQIYIFIFKVQVLSLVLKKPYLMNFTK